MGLAPLPGDHLGTMLVHDNETDCENCRHAMRSHWATNPQAERNRSDRAAWAVVGKQRADEVRRWLAEFRRAQGWQPGMVWDPTVAKYVKP